MRIKIIKNNSSKSYFTNFYNEFRKSSLMFAALMLGSLVFPSILYSLTKQRDPATVLVIFGTMSAVFILLALLYIKDFLKANQMIETELVINMEDRKIYLKNETYDFDNVNVELKKDIAKLYSRDVKIEKFKIFLKDSKKKIFEFNTFPSEINGFLYELVYLKPLKETYTRIYISRHGDYSNPKDINPFRSNEVSLSKKGIEQIEKNAEFLKDKNIAGIFSSPVQRCKETAEIYSKLLNVDLSFKDELIEVDSPYQSILNDKYDKVLVGESLYANKFHLENGGEGAWQIIDRMQKVLQNALAGFKDQNVLLVSHGDPIMLLFAEETGKKLDYEKKLEKQMKYIPKGGLIEMTYKGTKLHDYKLVNF